jgi:hypothetical protein
LIVSGFKTSPLDASRISSGEAKLTVIFEKLLFTLFSFLKAIYFFSFKAVSYQLLAYSCLLEYYDPLADG